MAHLQLMTRLLSLHFFSVCCYEKVYPKYNRSDFAAGVWKVDSVDTNYALLCWPKNKKSNGNGTILTALKRAHSYALTLCLSPKYKVVYIVDD